MKVLLLAPHPFFAPRGTPIAERALLEVLAAEGHDTAVLAFAEGSDPGIARCRLHRVPALPGTRGIRPGFSFKKLVCDGVMLVEALRLCRRERPDVVHAVEEAAFIALTLRALLGVPYVYDMDSHLAEQLVESRPWLRPLRRLFDAADAAAMRRATAILAVCRSLADRAAAAAPRVPLAVVEDASLLAEPAAGDGPAEASVGDETPAGDGPLLLYVGNLQPYQGIDLLLDAFAIARRRVPRARLAIVGGSPPLVARYRERVAALGLADAVALPGPRPLEQLGALLAQAAVVVSPRTGGHNTPMKVYSYLDSGRPLLATRLPTHTQVLGDDVALLADPEPAAFADGMVRLLEDETLRARLARAARELARREFTADAFRRKVVAFYDGVARRLGHPAPHPPLAADHPLERPATRRDGAPA